ncbi:MAG: DUF2098 domain-containing protein [Methanomicrobiales archaeon]|nr:DUF2098 domain-containing protein [Methanomicrobiales archaeon]
MNRNTCLEIIEPGSAVRYPRTGTYGIVTRLIERGENRFAEIDTTGLLYCLDQLIITELSTRPEKSMNRDEQLAELEKERRQREEDPFDNEHSLDGACTGAG